MSDFITSGYDTALQLAAQRHDLVGLHVYDQFEKELPSVGLLRVKDAETGRVSVIDTANKTTQDRQRQWFAEHEAAFRELFLRSGSDILSIRTGQDYIKSLLGFFKNRKR